MNSSHRILSFCNQLLRKSAWLTGGKLRVFRMGKQLPLVVILGATACGKSKLAIDIARRFGGEIISADSMQVYRGLDIVTNKVTDEEQSQARHHMISFLDPTQRYSVIDFRNKSLDIISNMMKADKLPIVVGGTNYYIESLLWKNLTLASSEEESTNESTLLDLENDKVKESTEGTLHTDEDLENPEKFFAKTIYGDGFKQIDSEKLWKILEQVDVKSAHKYHPHDKRRIIRCLQVIQRQKQNFSELFNELNKSSDAESLGGPLRFEKTCVLWLSSDNATLERVLDERVDQMIERGLLIELERFHLDYNEQRMKDGTKPEYDKGVFQTIGFKEFHPYLILDPDRKKGQEGEKILKRSIDAMKFSTKRYAKRQLKWIRRRFLQSATRDLPAIFELETTFDEETWTERVMNPALEVVDSFISNRPLTEEMLRLKREPEEQTIVNEPAKYYCEPCDRTFIGSHNIEIHLKSRTHERGVESSKRSKRIKIDGGAGET